MKNTTLHTIRYRANNSADGTCKRIACLMTVVIVTTVAITLLVLDHRDKNAGSFLRKKGYGDRKWDKLPIDAQHAAHVLDYDKMMWDNNEPFERFDRPWYELTQEQQEAAMTLGYDQSAWCVFNSDYDTEMEKRREYYPQYHWEALPDRAREALLVFGYNKKMWNHGNHEMKFEMDWDDMSLGKQEAAKALGYDQEIWCSQELSDDWGQGGSKPTNHVTSTHNNKQPHNNQQTVHQSLDGSTPTENPFQTVSPPLKTDAPKETNPPTNSPTNAPQKPNPEIPGYNLKWGNLSQKQLDAAELLGYDHIKWNHQKKIDAFDFWFSELDDEEKKAAITLGYDEIAWNDTKEHFESEKQEINDQVWGTGTKDGKNWFDDNWAYLPEEIKNAAITLGFRKEKWNQHTVPSSFHKDWDHLTSDEQAAANTLGYTEDTWGTKEIVYEETMDARREFYPDYKWDDLPEEVQNAANVFGFDKEKWDDDSVVIAYEADWESLSPEKQEAAKILGYDKDSWCEENATFVEETKTNWLQVEWEELPMDVREAAEIFGFGRVSWNQFMRLPEFDKEWNQLSKEEQDAAVVLGYNEQSWEFRWAQWEKKEEAGHWMNEPWVKMPEDVQSAAKVFGFTQETWDKGEKLDSYQQDWDKLTTPEMEAAKHLGFDKESWCDMEIKAKFEQMDWKDLPFNVQEAAKTLGMNQQSWDQNLRTDIISKEWNELTDVQKAAANTIGWNEGMWCLDWLDP